MYIRYEWPRYQSVYFQDSDYVMTVILGSSTRRFFFVTHFWQPQVQRQGHWKCSLQTGMTFWAFPFTWRFHTGPGGVALADDEVTPSPMCFVLFFSFPMSALEQYFAHTPPLIIALQSSCAIRLTSWMRCPVQLTSWQKWFLKKWLNLNPPGNKYNHWTQRGLFSKQRLCFVIALGLSSLPRPVEAKAASDFHFGVIHSVMATEALCDQSFSFNQWNQLLPSTWQSPH